ncbi:MAG: tRNA (N(6)-L-threonylcarbamoyladenosine(37)-C(2))-methylthiotransferase MtaB [Bacilli bacterium]|jgi:threonylcarbamoyladenosine tRNA methylthiotransferase MtaB
MRKTTFKTTFLGCKVNAYEVDAIRQQFFNEGFVEAQDGENVDIALINTCSVTSESDRKSRQQIRKLIKNYPNAIIIVMGCYSQYSGDLYKKIPEIDILVGTSNRNKIIDYIRIFKETGEKIIAVEENPRDFTYEDLKVSPKTRHARAYLKIQDGCDNFCTYCIIPYTRGRSRSRPLASVVNEAEYLVNNGYKEIILTGIDTGGYGRDIGTSLNELIKAIIHVCPSLYRLRISSLEINQVSDELLFTIKNNPQIARHLHIPLQAGSDEILKKMNRHYLTSDFYKRIEEIREILPSIALTTDVIVGFPGETEELFQKSYDFIKKCNFMMLHVFPYSKRPKTPAARLKDQITKEEKQKRVQKLIELSNANYKEYARGYNNKEVEVLIEGYNKDQDTYFGHTSNYLLVNVKSKEDITHKIVKYKGKI